MASRFTIKRSKTHVVSFKDHVGNLALSTWRSVVNCPLPFLFSYSIYFTNPEIRPDAPESVESARRLHDTITESRLYDSNDIEFRLDMYFIPNGTLDDCMRHYLAERDARGSWKVQARAINLCRGVRGSVSDDPEGDGHGELVTRLPGMVPSYVDDKSSDRYHALIYICDSADWRGGEDETMIRLEFDPVSRKQYEEFSKDWDDPREPDELPETKSVLEAIRKGSPGFGKPTGCIGLIVGTMGQYMYERSPEQRMGGEQWQRATEKGWTLW